ncbi:MAG: UvrD-helicase domain-containing protein [Acidobacteriota bacterium]|nr:UvrD-helicase domain-containing protein [Acidobacteriota bacterium]
MAERPLKKDPLPDAVPRRRIETDLDRNFLVEAGAGSGKTTSLVARMIALLAAGLAEPDSLVAVTFTRKAASQLRQRFQEKLEERLAAEKDPAVKERLDKAQKGLGLVRVGTIHSFCASLLRERPVEAGIDLGLSDVKLQEAALFQPLVWREWIAECSEKDDPRLAALEETGLRAQDLESAFVTLAEYPDVVPVVTDPPPERPALDGVRRRAALLLVEAEPLEPGEPLAGKEADPLQSALVRVGRLLEQPDAESDDGFIRVLEELEPEKLLEIKVMQWKGGKAAAQAFLARFDSFREKVLLPALLSWREWVHPRAMGFLLPALERLRTRRREEGFLTYEDLLLISRDVLRDQPSVRRYFRSRISHLLVDEFQDTDPLQAEIMLFLTSEDDRQKNAWKLRPKPGSLFVVGDPKQSIYRFRRADIETYETFTEIVKASGGEVLPLTSSFRTVDAAAEPVNRTFAGILPKRATKLQAAFAAIEARCAESGQTCGAFRLESRGDGNFREGRIREQNAKDVAAFVRHALAGGWKIPSGPGGSLITPRPSDILVLTVSRPALGEYAKALEKAGVPVEVTGSKAFAITKGLLALQPLLAAVNDPDDEVAIVAFLSGPLCGADDDTLWLHRKAGRRFAFMSDREPGTDPKIARGLGLLHDAQRDSRAFPPAAALVKIVGRLGLAASISAEEGGRTATGNLLKVLAWARRLSADGHSFADVASRLVDEAPELEEMSVDAARSNAVRLMNVHKAKGLEAPIVILAEPVERDPWDASCHVERTGDEPRGWFPITQARGEYGVRVLALPPDWKEKSRIEREFLAAELHRLFYVGATRAMFTLVASVHTKVTHKHGPELTGVWAPLDPYLAPLPSRPVPVPAPADRALPALASQLPDVRARISAAREMAAVPTYAVVSVTALAKRQGPRAPSPVEEARGAAWGRVLHQLLEAAMRNPKIVLEPLAQNLLREEEVAPDLLGELLRVAASVTASELWGRAMKSPRRFVEVPFEMIVPSKDLGLGEVPAETLLKGAMDLVFEEDGVWHIVDWKSDVVGDGLAALVAHYAPQVIHYRRAWEAFTKQPAKAGLFFMDTGEIVWLGEEGKGEKGEEEKISLKGRGTVARQGSLFDE